MLPNMCAYGRRLFLKLRHALERAERGASGVEMGILLFAPIMVASAVAGGLMRSGDAISQNLQATAVDAVQRVGSGIESNDAVFARTDGAHMTHVLIDVTTAAGGQPINLDPDARTGKTVVSYADRTTVQPNLPYTVHWITGNGDNLLEADEVAEVDVDISALSPQDRFSIEVRPVHGAYVSLHLQRPPGNPLPAILRLY